MKIEEPKDAAEPDGLQIRIPVRKRGCTYCHSCFSMPALHVKL